ncbi:MAG TPA: stalk domain-containing protein [Caldisericia bacterium]|nr:stalk domain-containing protein [Caldisericia bacterium]HPF48901.1 stalk domain-containing protein [Caldisericia bacterium]HPI83235.1 stalk domain-containing protein [Caldisericia bacterium]HPQ92462.1 stalk domain-containing protein [Caldisericia bacterium]HRV74440.1 stalk domain-containing protein [Caldisericia bacterium]
MSISKTLIIISVALFMVVATVTPICEPTGDFVCASELQYEVVKAIGYGPIGGQLTAPKSIGIDGDKIYIIDATSKNGSIFLSDGKFFKSFSIPGTLKVDELKASISPKMGNICYTTQDQVVVATTKGEIMESFDAKSTGKLTNPLAGFILNDLSYMVADPTNGIVLFDSNGVFVNRPIIPGDDGDVSNIFGVDVSQSGELAILSIVRPDSGNPQDIQNKITITTFSNTYSRLQAINVETDEIFNPSSGLIRFDNSGNVYFFTKDAQATRVYSPTGVLLESFDLGITNETNVKIGAGNQLYFVDGKFFYSTNSKLEDAVAYATFKAEPMQFGNPCDIAMCSGDGLVVFDKTRSDIQFFNESGLTGDIKLGNNADVLLSNNDISETLVYRPSNNSLVTYNCSGIETAKIELDPQIGVIDRLKPGRNGELFALDSNAGVITRLNKGGIYVNHFGMLGRGDDKFITPVDLACSHDGSVYVLDAGENAIKVFKEDGTPVRTIKIDELEFNNPMSMTVTESLDVVVADTGNHRIIIISPDGKSYYARGGATPPSSKKTIADYWQNLGTFNSPTRVVSAGSKLYVLDQGNIRIQVFEKGAIKIEPKLKIDSTNINFGDLRDESVQKSITISNTGNGTLSGSIESSAAWLVPSQTQFTGNTVSVDLKCDINLLPAWVTSNAIVTIKTNGGNVEINCNATRVGNKITLQINSPKGTINGQSVSVDPPPTILQGNTVVPLRFIGEALGATVEWYAPEKRVTYKLGDREVILWVGVREAKVNGQIMSMNISPTIINSRTVVPLRFIGEALGATVEWIGETRSINIYYPEHPEK